MLNDSFVEQSRSLAVVFLEPLRMSWRSRRCPMGFLLHLERAVGAFAGLTNLGSCSKSDQCACTGNRVRGHPNRSVGKRVDWRFGNPTTTDGNQA